MNAAEWWGTLDQCGFTVMRTLLSALWQSSIVFGAMALLVWMLRGRRATVRHTLWVAALLVAPVLPLLTSLASRTGAPQAQVSVLPSYTEPVGLPVVFVEETEPLPPFEPATAAPTAREPEASSGERPQASVLDYPWALLLVAYVAGVVFFLAWTALGRIRLRQWVVGAVPVLDERVRSAFAEAKERFGLRREFLTLESLQVPAPLTAGFLRPVVLLPKGLSDRLTDAELRAVALHETAHVVRRDPLILSLIPLVRAVLFFHPLVWLACRQVSRLSEQAADDAVLDATGEPVAYAKMLTRLAKDLRRRSFTTELAAGIVLSKGAFLRRVEAILSDRRHQIRRLSRWALACTVLAALLSLALAAALPLGERGPTSPQQASDSPSGPGDPPSEEAPVLAQGEPETADEVLARMAEARKGVRSAEYGIRRQTRYVLPVKASGDFDVMQAPVTGDVLVPAGTLTVHKERFLVSAEKYRYETSGPIARMMAGLAQRGLGPSKTTYVYDGDRGFKYLPDQGRVLVRTEDYLGLLITFGPLVEYHFGLQIGSRRFGLDDALQLAGKEERKGSWCYVLVDEVGPLRTSYYIDPERNWTLVRESTVVVRPGQQMVQINGRHIVFSFWEWDVEITHEKDESGVWRPATWTLQQFEGWGPDRELKSVDVSVVEKATLNASMPASTFVIDVPKGTVVYDQDRDIEYPATGPVGDVAAPSVSAGDPAPELVLEEGGDAALAQFTGRPEKRLTFEDIAAGIIASRSSLRSLRASYTVGYRDANWGWTEGEDGGYITRDQHTGSHELVVDNISDGNFQHWEKLRWYLRCPMPLYGPEAERVTAFDGEYQWCLYQPGTRRPWGTISARVDHSWFVWNSRIFGITYLVYSDTWEHTLKTGTLALKGPEALDGHLCYVLEGRVNVLPDIGHEGNPVKVWVDPDRGFAIVCLEVYSRTNGELDTFNSYDVLEMKKVAPNLWAPVHVLFRHGKEIVVKDITVNERLPEDLFTIKFPDGARVQDDRRDRSYTVVDVPTPPQPSHTAEVGKPASELLLEEEASLTLAQFRGKPVVLAFVSIYSRPCVKVLDELKALQEEKGADKLAVIAVHDRTATPEEIEQFRKEHGIPFPIVRVPDAPRDGWDSATFRAYGITALPTVVLIDGEGNVSSALGEGPLEGEVLKLLPESNPSSSTGGPSAERRSSPGLGREDVEALLEAVRRAMRPAENMQVKWRYETVMRTGLSLAPMDNLRATVRTEYVATIMGDRSRIDSRQQMYRTRESEEPYAIRSIVEVFDGTRQRRLERLLKGSGTPLRGYEELQDTNTSLLASALFDCVLPFHDAELLNTYSFSLEPGDVAGTYVLNAAPPLPDEQRAKRYRLTIDGNRGFHIIKTECLRPGRDFNKSHNYWGISDGTKYYEIDVALKELQDGIWFPFERTRTDYSFGRKTVRYKVSVTGVTFNVQVPDDTFQLEFPPGTKVWDRAREDWFIVLEEPPKPALVAEMGKVAPELVLEEGASVTLAQFRGKPVVLAKQEMLSAVKAARSRINDLSVSYSFDAIKAPADPDFWGARLHRTVVVKGAKTYIDFRYGPAAEYGKDLFRREVAFNGDRSTIHAVAGGVAWVQTKRERETETNGCGFFDLMLLNPPRANGYGSDDQSLISLLRSDLSLLRENTEPVNGHPCYVLDVTHPSLGKTHMTVWLDVQRGFLPMKHVYYFGEDLDQIIMEFTIEGAVELEEGLWFASRGYKRVGPVPAGSANPNWRMVHEMKVDGIDEGKPDIAVNTGVEDGFFDLWKRVPAGTRVVDFGAGTDWAAAAQEHASKPLLELGQTAPELVLEEGAGVTLAQFKGTPVVVAFVSIYSRPCVKVLDELRALQEEKGADALGVIAVHDRTATPEEIEEFRKAPAIPFPIVRVPEADRDGWDSATFRAYGVTALPTVVLVDAEGKVVAIGDGSTVTDEVQALLPKNNPSPSSRNAEASQGSAPTTEPSAPRRFHLRGRVLLPDGSPAAGATVELMERDAVSKRWAPMVTRTTDDEGHYDLGWQAVPMRDEKHPSYAALYATLKGYAIQGATVVFQRSGGPGLRALEVTKEQVTYDLKLIQSVSYGGTIVGSDSKPLQGVTVWVTAFRMRNALGRFEYIYAPTDYQKTETDQEGRFQVGDVPAGGTVLCHVEKKGHVIARFGLTESGDNTFTLPEAGAVEGRVIFEDTGKPAANVRVFARSSGGRRGPSDINVTYTESVQAVTDEQGRFKLEPLLPGKASVRIDLKRASEIGYTAEKGAIVAVQGGGTASAVVLELIKGTILRGLVVDAVSGKPVLGAHLQVDRSVGDGWEGYPHPETDAQGRYSLRVPAGTYRLRFADAEGYVTGGYVYGFFAHDVRFESVTVKEGQETQAPTIKAPPAATVTVKVRTPAGRPAPGILVNAKGDSMFGRPSFGGPSGRTDDSGDVRFPGLKPGSTVQVSARNATGTLLGSADVTPKAGDENEVVIRLVSTSPGKVIGTLTNEAGRAIVGAEVSLDEPSGDDGWRRKGFASSGAGGRFEMTGLSPGSDLVLRVGAPGYGWLRSQSFSLDSGQTQDMGTLTLARADRTIAGRVVDRNDEPVAGLRVQVSGRQSQPPQLGRTDKEGRFQFSGLVNEPLQIFVSEETTRKTLATPGVQAGDKDIHIRIVSLGEKPKPDVVAKLGEHAPELVLEEGADITLAQFKGRPVVLAFVSIYSRPCVKVLDQLRALQEEKGADALGVIAVHDRTATPEEIEEFRKAPAIPFPIVRVPDAPRDGWDSETFRAYGVTALPTVVLISANGQVVSVGDGSKLEETVPKLMPKGNPASASSRTFSGLKNIADIKPPFTFRIHTVTPQGEPQAGVKIRCLHPIPQRGEVLVHTVVSSDAKGVALFRVTRADLVAWRFFSFFLADDRFVGTPLAEISPLDNEYAATFKVLPAEEFRLRVVDENNKPVPKARVWLRPDYPGYPGWDEDAFVTDAYGHSNSEGVASVRFANVKTNIVASAAGYAPTFIRAVDLSKQETYEIRMGVGLKIRGGVVDELGGPLAGVRITATLTDFSLTNSERSILRGTTDTEGTFVLLNASQGTYEIQADIEDPANPVWIEPLTWRVSKDASSRQIELQAKPGAVLKGRYFTNHETLAIADRWIRVNTFGPDRTRREFRTNEDGSFVVRIPIGKGGYIEFVGVSGFHPVVKVPEEYGFLFLGKRWVEFGNARAGIYDGITVELVLMATARGRVVDTFGKPLSAKWVAVQPRGRLFRTDAKGAYAAEIPPNEEVTLEVRAESSGETVFQSEPFTLKEGEVIEKNITIGE